MDINEIDLKKTESKFKIVWSIMVVGMFLFYIIAWYLVKKRNDVVSFKDFQILSYFTYLAMIIALPLGYYLFDNIVKKSAKNLIDYISTFKKAYFAKYIVFMSAGLLSSVFYLLSGKPEGVYTGGIVLIALLINKPSSNVFLKLYETEYFKHRKSK